MTRRGVVRAPARRANACGRSRSRRSRPERREGGTHERPEPRGPGRYPGFTRIETPASGAAHSIGGDRGGERRDVAAGRTTQVPTRERRLRREARALCVERSRQAVRHRSGVSALERVTVRRRSCQPNHWRGLLPFKRSVWGQTPYGPIVRIQTQVIADHTETVDPADCAPSPGRLRRQLTVSHLFLFNASVRDARAS